MLLGVYREAPKHKDQVHEPDPPSSCGIAFICHGVCRSCGYATYGEMSARIQRDNYRRNGRQRWKMDIQ